MRFVGTHVRSQVSHRGSTALNPLGAVKLRKRLAADTDVVGTAFQDSQVRTRWTFRQTDRGVFASDESRIPYFRISRPGPSIRDRLGGFSGLRYVWTAVQERRD